MATNTFPWTIRDVNLDLLLKLKKLFKNNHSNYIHVGPKAYFLPGLYKEVATAVYNLKFRPDDILVLGYPRSGTTRMRELVWIIANDWDFKRANTIIMEEKYRMMFGYHMDEVQKKELTTKLEQDHTYKASKNYGLAGLDQAESPRFISFHLPLSLVSPHLLDTSKVVYVARDPRDVAVSFYHLQRRLKMFNYVGDFKTFWNLFVNGLITWAPHLEHVKEAWSLRHHPNFLFLFYEDVSQDLPSNIRRVASFLGKSCNEEQVLRMCKHLDIENFRRNNCVNLTYLETEGFVVQGEQPFIRKGKSGGWRDYFDEEMTKQAECWMEHNLRDIDLRFPPT